MGASRQGLRGRGHANDGGQRLCSAPSQMMELAVKAYAGACVRNHLLRQSLTSRLTRVRASATICCGRETALRCYRYMRERYTASARARLLCLSHGHELLSHVKPSACD